MEGALSVVRIYSSYKQEENTHWHTPENTKFFILLSGLQQKMLQIFLIALEPKEIFFKPKTTKKALLPVVKTSLKKFSIGG